MGRFKDSLGAVPLTSGRSAWKNASGRNPCPVCLHDSWCSIRADGALVACRREPSPHEKLDRADVVYWVHVLDEQAPPLRAVGPAVEPGAVERAPASVLDEAYRAVLSALRLTEAHAADLERRGLDARQVAERGYRSLPLEGRSALAALVVERVGEAAARGVPGLRVAEREGRTWWTFGGATGLLIPVRDVAGRIVALKVRRDGDGEGPRYTYVSSAQHGGAGALLAVHVPLLSEETDCTRLRISEGELKSDVASALTYLPTLSLPGVGSWRAVLPVLRQLACREAVVSFDADHRDEPAVATACALLLRALDAEGFSVAVERWDARLGKGVDDVVVKYGAGALRLLEGAAVRSYPDWLLDQAERIRRAREGAKL